jgi:ABC-type branched-subunit amino acid transport system substrate-binding protein
LNPDLIISYGGGPVTDAGVLKAAYAAGWRGAKFALGTGAASQLMGITGPEAAEGVVGLAYPAEFEPATSPEGREFKAAYIAKYGKWTDPSIILSSCWWILKGALLQAGSVDPEKVRAALDNGKPVVCPIGTMQQFARTDQGATRTNSAVHGNLPIKQIQGGKVVQIGTTNLQEQLDIMKAVWGGP